MFQESQIAEQEQHVKREIRSKKIFDKSVPEKKSHKPLNGLLLEKDIRLNRKYERVPIEKDIKNKGTDESVKEEQEDSVRKTRDVTGTKQAILRMGFRSILQVNNTSYPGQLSYYLLDVYDTDSRRLVLQNSVIKITEQTMHDMMGLSIDGEDINELPLYDKGNQILEEWKGQYTGDKFNVEEYLRRIQATTKDSLMFTLNFLTLFVKNFIESMLMGTNQIKVLVYVYNMKYAIKLGKRLPFNGHITGANLLEIQRFEISVGGFGRQFWDEHEDVDMKDETRGEEEQLVSFKRDFGDEEAYAALLEHSYGIIVTEKHTMEVALKDGLEKLPDSVVLKEWMEKMNEHFMELHEGENNKKVHESEGYNN
ncbi:unnamed protein product [Lactuca saligna]|uniref:Uncharacterized protein n=1 Tax=Lactuca saligna TaxID=75948 RepID=A0AA35YCZ6_LACSI|nr:unnamed protein product [Lactuca saligna]